MPDPSCVCNLHHSLWPHWILSPLSEARDRIHILMDTSGVLNPPWATTGTTVIVFLRLSIVVGVKGYFMWFQFAFPTWLVMLRSFSCTYWPFVHLRKKVYICIFLSILKLAWVIIIKLYILDKSYSLLSDIWFSNIFSYSVGSSSFSLYLFSDY